MTKFITTLTAFSNHLELIAEEGANTGLLALSILERAERLAVAGFISAEELEATHARVRASGAPILGAYCPPAFERGRELSADDAAYHGFTRGRFVYAKAQDIDLAVSQLRDLGLVVEEDGPYLLLFNLDDAFGARNPHAA